MDSVQTASNRKIGGSNPPEGTFSSQVSPILDRFEVILETAICPHSMTDDALGYGPRDCEFKSHWGLKALALMVFVHRALCRKCSMPFIGLRLSLKPHYGEVAKLVRH